MSFAGNGKKTISFGGIDKPRAVLVQPDGKIVVAGGGAAANSLLRRAPAYQRHARHDIRTGREAPDRLRRRQRVRVRRGAAAGRQDRARRGLGPRVAVARLNRNGSSTPRSPAMARRFSWGAIAAPPPCSCCRTASPLAGSSGPEGGNIQVARLNANGALDTTFGTVGKAPIDFGGDDFGASMARQANGRILVAGRSTTTGAVVAAAASSRGCGRTARSTRTSTATGA